MSFEDRDVALYAARVVPPYFSEPRKPGSWVKGAGRRLPTAASFAKETSRLISKLSLLLRLSEQD